MVSLNDIQAVRSAVAYSRDGHKVGRVGDVYVDDLTNEPAWVTLSAGLFGTRTLFAPLGGSTLEGDRLVLGFAKAVIDGAPAVADSGHISDVEQQALLDYYQGRVASEPADAPAEAPAAEAVAAPAADLRGNLERASGLLAGVGAGAALGASEHADAVGSGEALVTPAPDAVATQPAPGEPAVVDATQGGAVHATVAGGGAEGWAADEPVDAARDITEEVVSAEQVEPVTGEDVARDAAATAYERGDAPSVAWAGEPADEVVAAEDAAAPLDAAAPVASGVDAWQEGEPAGTWREPEPAAPADDSGAAAVGEEWSAAEAEPTADWVAAPSEAAAETAADEPAPDEPRVVDATALGAPAAGLVAAGAAPGEEARLEPNAAAPEDEARDVEDTWDAPLSGVATAPLAGDTAAQGEHSGRFRMHPGHTRETIYRDAAGNILYSVVHSFEDVFGGGR